MRGGWLLVAAALLAACGDGGGKDVRVEEPPPTAFVVDLGPVALTELNQDQTFDVLVAGTSSVAIVADGGSAGDIDIDLLNAPEGAQLVTPARDDANPVTGNASPQHSGQSVATVLVPSTPRVPLEHGTYTFSLASFDPRSFTLNVPAPATVHLTAIINTRNDPVTGVLPLNVFFVGTHDLNAANALSKDSFQTVIEIVRQIFGRISLRVEVQELRDVTGEAALRFGLLDVLIPGVNDRLVLDRNLNRQSDEMDELLPLSATVDNRAVNLFMVDEFFEAPGLLAFSSATPGPPVIQGTVHSGIVVSTLGGLDDQSEGDLELLGHTIAHELGHYLGLFHTSELNGAGFDPLGDTPECRAAPPISFAACQTAGGRNLMFPSIEVPDQQGELTADQAFVLLRNPAVVDQLPLAIEQP